MADFLGVGLIFLGFLVALVAISAIMAYPVMLLWNGCLVGAVDGVHTVDFSTAWGLLILAGFLFKDGTSSFGKSKS